MTQRLVSFGDDYFVENAAGERVFKIDGKVLRVRNTLQMTDLRTGDEYRVQQKLARVRNTMAIQKNRRRFATVHKAVVTPIRDRFRVSTVEGQDIEVQGNVLNHEYRLSRGGRRVAEVSKQWFRLRDSYGVEVAPEMDTGLAIACAVTLDMMAHPAR